MALMSSGHIADCGHVAPEKTLQSLQFGAGYPMGRVCFL